MESETAVFELFEWHPKYVSCQRFFLDHSQHSGPVQAVAAFLNILLPYQRDPPTTSSAVIPSAQALSFAQQQTQRQAHQQNTAPPINGHHSTAGSANSPAPLPGFAPTPSLSLFPYIRRLVATGLDFPGVLHGFFGDDWAVGIGPLHEQERRNYLFAGKSGGWATVKREYDLSAVETVPFLRPLQGVVEPELVAAERNWSEFLAFEDWMVGPRAPGHDAPSRGQATKDNTARSAHDHGPPLSSGHQDPSQPGPQRHPSGLNASSAEHLFAAQNGASTNSVEEVGMAGS